MALALDFLTTWKDGLNNKDSSQCGNIMADDWQFVASGTIARGIPRDKPNTLDWISGGGNQIIIDNFEILYENDEVAVGTHTAIGGESFSHPFLKGQLDKRVGWEAFRASSYLIVSPKRKEGYNKKLISPKTPMQHKKSPQSL